MRDKIKTIPSADTINKVAKDNPLKYKGVGKTSAMVTDPHITKDNEPQLINKHSLAEPWEYLSEREILKFYGEDYLKSLLDK